MAKRRRITNGWSIPIWILTALILTALCGYALSVTFINLFGR